MKLRFNTQKILSFTIAYMVSFLGLLNGTNALTNAVGYNTSLDTVILYAALWGLAAFVWFCMLRKWYFRIDVFLLVIFFVLILTLTLLIFPENTKYIHSSAYTFFNHPILVWLLYSFTGYVAVRCLNGYQDLLKYLTGFSYLVIFLSAIVYFWIKDSFANQYMTLSYNMLLQVCFLLFFPPKNRKLLNGIFIGIGSFIIVFGGARGAMVALLVAVILKILGFESKVRTKQKQSAMFFLILLGGFAYVFYEELLSLMSTFIESLGFASRNLALLTAMNIDISTGRIEIYSKLLKSSTLFGHGLFGDRVILGGTYAHNLFIEWIAAFGLLGGGCLSLVYITILIWGYKYADKQTRKLMLVSIPNGLIGLMFSNSFLAQQPAFYVLLGLCVNVLIKSRKDIEEL